MGEYVLGVDGGSTKTHCALFDMAGELVDFLRIGSTNHETLKDSYSEFGKILGAAIHDMAERHHIGAGSIRAGVFGLSGADTRRQHANICSEVEKIGLADFMVCNDSFLGIKAGSRDGFGICVINGSGCTVSGINRSGRTFLIGGQGEFTGDQGGGGFLGYCAIRSVYDQLFKEGNKTLMKDMLFDTCGIDSKYEYMDVVREKIEDGEITVTDLAKMVFQAANHFDKVALDILRHMGDEIGISVNGVIRELGFDGDEELNIILAGSVNVKGENDTYIDTLKRKVLCGHENMRIHFSILRQPPVIGAVQWAFERALGACTFRDRLEMQLSRMS